MINIAKDDDELRVVENGSKPISEGPGGRDLTLAETTNLYLLLPSLALIILCNIPGGELTPRLLSALKSVSRA